MNNEIGINITSFIFDNIETDAQFQKKLEETRLI